MIGKRNQIQESYRTIALPAAILNRSPLKASKISRNSSIMENSILSDKSNIVDGPVCSNHPNKSAKYFIISDDDEQSMDYCEKCAILLASQGFKVNRHEKIQQSQQVLQVSQKPTREQQLQQFVNKADDKFQKLKNTKQQITSFIEQLPHRYQQNIERIDNFFSSMLTLIQKHQTKCLKLAKEQKQNSQITCKLQLQFLQEKLDVVDSMKEDILASYDSIVKETPQTDYKLVMSHYNKTLEQIIIKQPTYGLHEPFLPEQQVLQQIFSSTIGKDLKQTHFSFEISRKNCD